MNRELKFRGWCPSFKRWIFAPEERLPLSDFWRFVEYKNIDPATVGQWTTKQVGGQDAYEGDRVRITYHDGTVVLATIVFETGSICPGFTMMGDDDVPRALGHGGSAIKSHEIIGTIHDQQGGG